MTSCMLDDQGVPCQLVILFLFNKTKYAALN